MLLCELFLCELLLCKLLLFCDEDTLVYMVNQTTAACHTGHRSCFYRTLDGTITSERLFDPEQVYGKK